MLMQSNIFPWAINVPSLMYVLLECFAKIRLFLRCLRSVAFAIALCLKVSLPRVAYHCLNHFYFGGIIPARALCMGYAA